MTWAEAQKCYGVSKSSISKILKEENREALTEKRVRGRKTPLTADMLIFVMLKIEEDSQITLKTLVNDVEKSSPSKLQSQLYKELWKR